MENYKILGKIGSGSFAKVHMAIHRPTGKKVALKVIQKSKISTEKLRQRLTREISNMRAVRHENIVEYYDSFENDKEMCIAMEYLPGGELFDFIAEQQGLNETQGRIIFGQIAEAVKHCHKNNISHRDLKLENILLSKSGKPKLVDFGFSKETHSNPMLATYCGSPLYASPEMIIGRPYEGPECDIWSLGVILFCMLTACMPFDDQDWGSFVTSLDRADYPRPPNVSQNVEHLLSRMLDPCSHTRATIDEVLNHPWLNPKSRKTSLQLPQRRRVGISHSQSAALEISKNLIAEAKLAACSCQCHTETNKHRDSAIALHCEECEPVTPMGYLNRPINKCVIGMSMTSVCSSGYSSSTESLINSPSLSPDLSERQTHDHSTKTALASRYGCFQCLDTDDDESVELIFA